MDSSESNTSSSHDLIEQQSSALMLADSTIITSSTANINTSYSESAVIDAAALENCHTKPVQSVTELSTSSIDPSFTDSSGILRDTSTKGTEAMRKAVNPLYVGVSSSSTTSSSDLGLISGILIPKVR